MIACLLFEEKLVESMRRLSDIW